MIYVTVRLPPHYHQMTLEEFLYDTNAKSFITNGKESSTRTYEVNYISNRIKNRLKYDSKILVHKLKMFNEETSGLRNVPRKDLYDEFRIPKKKGGLRKINAPHQELMDALRKLKTIFEEDFGALYHTSAFAYIKRRSTIDAIKRHQANESRWFAKYDLSDFFGSTTLDFVLKMLSIIYPFSEVISDQEGKRELTTALELAFLDGGLPQGTPISPIITNIMMIPVDYKLSNTLRDYEKQYFIYTRYADDFIISSRYNFDFHNVEGLISKTLADFGAPFTINRDKTRYGSSAGSNWNLGLMLGHQNKITVGYKNIKIFKAMLHNFVRDTTNGIQWSREDVQVLEGYRNYYRMVEKNTIDAIVDALNKKLNVDTVAMIKAQLKSTM